MKNLKQITSAVAKRISVTSAAATVKTLQAALSKKKLPSAIETNDGDSILAVSQTLVFVDEKSLKALAKTLMDAVGAKDIKSSKGVSADDDAFTTFSVAGTTFFIAPYISYEGANDGGVGGIYVAAVN